MESEDFDYLLQEKLHRSKGKCAIYSRQNDVCVKVKQNKSTQVVENHNNNNNNEASDFTISTDIWYQIASRIEPLDIQTFALISPTTAKLASSRSFWRNIYTRYCLKSKKALWNLQLPEHLQPDAILYQNCDIRSRVIEALFLCHQPLIDRLNRGYKLDFLLHRTFVSHWQKNVQCVWTTCYKLWNHLTSSGSGSTQHLSENESAPVETSMTVNDWESLFEAEEGPKESRQVKQAENPYAGVSLLLICSISYVPLPAQLSYGNDTRYRLTATRQLLGKDMRATNLELDFSNDTKSSLVTVKYPAIKLVKVMPWWHPKFKTFVK